jgi:predicted RNA binding protein YcfA (HicA-like mRNA interferase family)
VSKLPHISSRECVRALEKKGFYVVSQAGSHIKMRRDTPYAQVIVPVKRELAVGTLRSILRTAGLTVEEFIALL